MRGIGHTLSRLPAARMLIAGAALLAVAAAPKAYGQPAGSADDTALAVPRVAPRGGGGDIALPRPLAPSDAARIRLIFARQARGDIAAAIRDTAELDAQDTLMAGMIGHLVADRHLGRFTRTPAADLQAWLERWPDLPDAPSIHALLRIRLPRKVPLPPAPQLVALSEAPHAAPVPEESEPVGHALPRLPALDREIAEAARSGTYGAASRAILAAADLPLGYAAWLRGEAGQILFALNRDKEAYEVAARGAESCLRARGACVSVAAAGHWAGLAAWRRGQVEAARRMFELAWKADVTSSAQHAAAAFWAARAHARLGDAAGQQRWLERAALERRTFYGLLARRMLGRGVEIDSVARETLGEADLAAIAAHPPGLRAFALLQVDQRERAEAELRLLWPAAQHAPALARAVMLVAERAGLIHLAAQMADIVQAADGRPRERTRFAVPRLRPAGGFTADPALVYAIARTESNFDPAAISPAGARGLMQIMPATARFVTGEAGSSEERLQLHDPAVNLDIGQRYLGFLAGTDTVGGDLLRLLASYNSGPTAFARWSAAMRHDDDPLLFIEAIPVDETRAFIARVLTYTWLYAARLRLPTPSLDDLAEGRWPRYGAPETVAVTPVRLH